MDNNTTQNIRLYQNCDEITAWAFEQVRKGNYNWLVYGYDGWGDVDLPSNYKEIWQKILDENLQLSKNNSATNYFELVSDISDAELRLEIGTMLLTQIAERWGMMSDEIKQGYIDRLKDFRFHLNTSKDFNKELERLYRQLKAIKMKLSTKRKEREHFEKTNPKSDVIELKVKIQKLLKMQVDLKKMSQKEWLLTIEEALSTAKSNK